MSLITRIPMFRHVDNRGILLETYHDEFEIKNSKVVVSSKARTWHGMHYQVRNVQAKLVTCIRGRIYAKAIDMRAGHDFGEFDAERVMAGESILIAKGAAFGYMTACDDCIVTYHCDAPHDEDAERCVRMPKFIEGNCVISHKDRTAPLLLDAERITL